jgi:hypothetical protein
VMDAEERSNHSTGVLRNSKIAKDRKKSYHVELGVSVNSVLLAQR